jgi:fructosamine-3-kinase
MWTTLAEHIAQVTGRPFVIEDKRAISGGSINAAYRISGGQQSFFVKLNARHCLEMFRAEYAGLLELAPHINAPQPLAVGVIAETAYLVMAWLDLGHEGDWVKFGQNLAALHRVTAPSFGWQHDNYIGSTSQPNIWSTDWIGFWREQRLGYQLQLAQQKGLVCPEAPRLLARLPEFFEDYDPQPSLVHGDLWSGNAGFTRQGEPVIFDPALYYGDREVDIAMTELFGGYPEAFYCGYQQAYPLDRGYAKRKELYNLYHILNHFNLFGGGYGRHAQRMIQVLAL